MINNNQTAEQIAIAQAEHALAEAHLTMNLTVIEELLHDDYTILHPDGRKEDKSAVLKSYRQGEREWKSADVSDLQIAVSGNLALARGTWTARGKNGRSAFDYSAQFLSMWRKDNGRWQNIAYQSLEEE